MMPGPERDEFDDEERVDRSKFLWNQQRYILENIKLADTKAGFVLTISAALLGTNLLPSGHLQVHLVRATTARSVALDGVDVLGIALLLGAVLVSAWSIAPRLRSSGTASPVSWVNVARYPDAESFREANRTMSVGMAADYLCEQVFYMARICARKHWLVRLSILMAAAGACCVAVALILQ